MNRIQFTPDSYGLASWAAAKFNGDELRRLNEALHSSAYRWRQQVDEFLETHLREAVTARLGWVPPLEELVDRMHRYIAHDHHQEVIVLDHQPLLHVEWEARLGHPNSLGVKVTPMQPASPLPFPIADL